LRNPVPRLNLKIKAIVFHGEKKREVAHPDRLEAFAKETLERGKDVLVEKPLALNEKDAVELMEVAERKKRILMVGHLLIYHPVVVRLKEMVRSDELGKIHYIYTQRVNLGVIRQDENALWSFAPHDLSIILHLVEEEPIIKKYPSFF
jgi:UDP-2-acetamido-3-amino-2,3-dideoxy-glucuronate N-acetyltransferase